MASIFEKPASKKGAQKCRLRNALLFVAIAFAWIAFDQTTKYAITSAQFKVGEHFGGPFLGMFQFTLVHNTGGAWGIFSDSTLILASFSLIVCVAIAVFCLVFEPYAPIPAIVGFALVFAGGVGNVIDRFAHHFVVDFIDLTFMDFPVFNIADIGVTCGLVIVFITLLFHLRHTEDTESPQKPLQRPKTKGDV